MDYRFMGRTGLRVSRLGLGTMHFGGPTDEPTAWQVFSRARDAGINLFDCADVYNEGRAESFLGRFIRTCRHDVVITTKAYFPTYADPNARGLSRYHLMRAVEASLARLATDRIDLFFMHRFDEATALDETLRALDDLVTQGKILYLGASNFAAWETMKALGLADRLGFTRLCAIQPMYNLVKRQAEVELLPLARAESLAVFPYGPLGGGLLTGRYGPDRRPAQGRLVDNPMYRTRYAAADNYLVAERFVALAHARGFDPIALAIAWVAAHPAVTAPLIGPRDPAQLEPALAALDIPMSPELYAEIAALSPTPPPATDRNEETTADNYGTR